MEAQSCGTPVVATKIPVHQEIAKDSVFFVETDIKSITRGIEEVLGSTKLQESLKLRGVKNAHRFSWEKTTRETLKVYENILQK